MRFYVIPLFLLFSPAIDAQDEISSLVQKPSSSAILKDTQTLSVQMLSPYSFSVGSNFDFIDGVDLQDLYFNVATFTPGLLRLGNMKIGANIGVRKSYARSYDSFFQNYDLEARRIFDGQFETLTMNLDRSENLSLTNTNFYFNPIISIFENPSSSFLNSSLNFLLYLSLDVDMMKQELDWTYTYDTVSILSRVVTEEEYIQAKAGRAIPSESYDQFIYSVGVGLPMFIEKDEAIFYAKPGVGYSRTLRQNFWDFHRFYAKLEFEIIEREFGLNLRTEFRFFQANRPPYISFNIAKYFNIRRFTDFMPAGA